MCLNDISLPSFQQVCKANYKYLCAENYRQSLVFQKKYLLKLINGYHTTDVMTITMLAKITDEIIDYHQTSLSLLSLFRSVTYAIIALHRMLYLVNQWKKAVHSYSCNSIQPATENVQQKAPPYSVTEQNEVAIPENHNLHKKTETGEPVQIDKS
ncbi:pericentrin-like [Tachypleus tridentatus]|uniref:pericentrin-like n=1 Tax=Tachypleus tridentatus TaxID=6853 RepID=UPI003FD59DA0